MAKPPDAGQASSGRRLFLLPLKNPIRKLRESRGLSLRELAQASDVDYRRICYAERGLELRGVELLGLARALGCTVSELVSGRHQEDGNVVA